MPEDRLKTSNKSQDKVTAAQVAAVNKLLKESVKTTDDLAKNMQIILKAFKENSLGQEGLNELLDEQVDKYAKAKKLASELVEYAKDYSAEQRDLLTTLDVAIAQEKVIQHDQRVRYSYEIESLQKGINLAHEKNKLYVLEEETRR